MISDNGLKLESHFSRRLARYIMKKYKKYNSLKNVNMFALNQPGKISKKWKMSVDLEQKTEPLKSAPTNSQHEGLVRKIKLRAQIC